jgi:hypothetical protein
VIVKKVIRCRVTFEADLEVPHAWTADDSLDWERSDPGPALLTIATAARAGWTYLVPGYDWFGYRDRNGVLHSFQADAARYDRSTNDYQVLIRGHWLSVGRDVEQLTNEHN